MVHLYHVLSDYYCWYYYVLLYVTTRYVLLCPPPQYEQCNNTNEASQYLSVPYDRFFCYISGMHMCVGLCALPLLWFGQAFENLDREGKGFLTSQGIKEVVGLDFEAEEVSPLRLLFQSAALLCWGLYDSSGTGCHPTVVSCHTYHTVSQYPA